MSLAIFDLDETLIDGDCSSLWCQRMAQLGWVDDAFVQRDADLMTAYAEGQLAMEEYMAFALEPLIGRMPEELEPEIAAYVEEIIEPLIFSDACRYMAKHRAAGDRILIISASGAHLVAPIAERLGVQETLAIDLDVQHGVYTGRTQGILTYREGKLTRLLEYLEGDESSLATASFYSDSRNDLTLLERVGHPYAVNPDPYLRNLAEQRDWPILAWR
ncbi:HAD superfamily hydrolase (TIGR01490 family) [Pseudomonas duriflava]|uniref:HAD superfamily hydrolase (TIGR01490 family) n=1 Tax=Pseudomonas duriflava TaxID=459528 RepID=A0A562QFX4_9PSED|nr:HAD family hydrolase [Pseudomonas duriflava]TWI55644.1 HAD superfamily hydrolase (TIGR01490 family) [Pseudomonas duriflava]